MILSGAVQIADHPHEGNRNPQVTVDCPQFVDVAAHDEQHHGFIQLCNVFLSDDIFSHRETLTGIFHNFNHTSEQ